MENMIHGKYNNFNFYQQFLVQHSNYIHKCYLTMIGSVMVSHNFGTYHWRYPAEI